MNETSFDNKSVKDPKNAISWSEEVVSSHNCCQRWWSHQKCTTITTIILLILLILLAILLLILLINGNITLHKSDINTVCLTKSCVKAASTILNRIDTDADPCLDFYTYACGNFIRKNTVPDDYYLRNLLQEMQDEVYIEMKGKLESERSEKDGKAINEMKLLYLSCMNESSYNDHQRSLKGFYNLFERIGGEWPILQPNYSSTKINLEYRLASLFLYQVQPFFQLFILSPEKNSTQYAIHLYSGSTVLESIYYTHNGETDEYENQLNSYISLIKDVVRLFAHFKGIEQNKLNANDIIEMVRLESDLANMTRDAAMDFYNISGSDHHMENMVNRKNLINPNSTNVFQTQFIYYTIDQLEEEFEVIKWRKLFKHIFSESQVETSDILIHSRDYMSELIKLINKYSLRTIDNYLCWTLIARYMPYLGPQFRRIFSDFRAKVPEISNENSDSNGSERLFMSRWKECVHIVSEGLHIPATVLYLNNKTQIFELIFEKINDILKNIKIAFNLIIDSQEWIQNLVFKEKCKQRTNSIFSKIGFPKFLNNKSQIDYLYKDLSIVSGDMFISNILKMSKHEVILEVKKLNQKVNQDTDWIYQPLIANAFYDPANNNIILPSGILRYPLIDFGRPRYIDYATLGVVIGHEVAHCVDSESKKFMNYGNGTNWWSSNLYQLYKEKAKCFAQQYAEYEVEPTKQNINGNHTLEENICDFAGLQQAFTAFKLKPEENNIRLPGLTNFTADQLFFIQYAQIWCEVSNIEGIRKSLNDNHSPGKFRANGVLVNMPQFANAFKCPENSPMNPRFKCNLWANN